jgi:hypothetical protein
MFRDYINAVRVPQYQQDCRRAAANERRVRGTRSVQPDAAERLCNNGYLAAGVRVVTIAAKFGPAVNGPG